jgi:hypothetical protein
MNLSFTTTGKLDYDKPHQGWNFITALATIAKVKGKCSKHCAAKAPHMSNQLYLSL